MVTQLMRIGLLLSLSVALTQGLTVKTARAMSESANIPDLNHKVTLLQDGDGIRHIFALDAHDLFLAQGWAHARDRLFQMDVLRRQASGTLAELVGPAALESDVQLRTIGLRRAAARSWLNLSSETQQALTAYAEGVNAYIASAAALPIEYGALELTQVEAWTVVDSLSIAKLLSFSLSFDLDIAPTLALQAYQTALPGLQGLALYFEDTHRSAPFDTAATVPDALGLTIAAAGSSARTARESAGPEQAPDLAMDEAALALARGYLNRIKDVPVLQSAIDPRRHDRGSNTWVVAGTLTDSGRPFLASDQHLELGTPATFYPIHLVSKAGGYDVIGDSLPGAPFVLVGHNRDLAWGTTNHRIDVTDTFQEQLVPDPTSPSNLSSLYLGNPEHVIPLPQVFRYNQPNNNVLDDLATAPPGGTVFGVSIPAAVLIVPRRNNGPILDLDPATGVALSVQYTGFSGTREADTFRLLNLSESLQDVIAALQFFDVGAQHFMVAHRAGDIAYFTNAELPLREDLQSEVVSGLPPYFIRDGQGGNEWLAVSNPQPGQSLPYEILPFEEMPQLINPPSDIISNANNDALAITFDNDPLNQLRPGGGIFYLAQRFSFGTRAGRIKRALAESAAVGLLSPKDMIDIQADVVLPDAEVLTPYILQAFANASAPGAHSDLAAIALDLDVEEAADRFALWDHTAPTGIFEGFDANDVDGQVSEPSEEEVGNSIAATIYSVWRAQMVINTIDATLGGLGLPSPDDEQSMTALRHLLDSFDTNHGVGASGIDFFQVPGITDPATRRDYVILKSLADALALLASADFQDAFGGSSDQDDYQWGVLHRLVLAHPLTGPFSLPPDPEPGFPVDGGFGTVDAATHVLRATTSSDFGFPEGPTRRYLGEVGNAKGAISAESSLPGGTSGAPGDPFRTNLLFGWLTNDTYPMQQARNEIAASTGGVIDLSP